MQSLINFSFSQCTDKGVFCSLFTVPLSLCFAPNIFSFLPYYCSPSSHQSHFLSATSTASLSTAFLNNHRIPDPISYCTWTECCCCLFLQESSRAHEQTGTMYFKSYILAARSILHTKLHVIKYINMLQLGLTWEMKWVIRLDYRTNSRKIH